MVILGTQYAGEMKKGIFTIMHYLMPKRGILSLHSGCNVGKNDDVTLFFGLSGVLSHSLDLPSAVAAHEMLLGSTMCPHLILLHGKCKRFLALDAFHAYPPLLLDPDLFCTMHFTP